MPRCCVKDLPDQLELHSTTEPKDSTLIPHKDRWKECGLRLLTTLSIWWKNHLFQGLSGYWPWVKIMVPKGLCWPASKCWICESLLWKNNTISLEPMEKPLVCWLDWWEGILKADLWWESDSWDEKWPGCNSFWFIWMCFNETAPHIWLNDTNDSVCACVGPKVHAGITWCV